MRPVDRGNPANYPYTGPGTLNVNVPAFHAPSAMCTVYNQAGAFVRTVAWVQNELLARTVLGAPFPNPSTPLNRARAGNLMRSRLEDIYRTSRADLVANLGDFCSFCELPLAGHLLAVEHRVPKSDYPTFTVLWTNFLLACRDCNSVKGTQPPRATAIAWAGGALYTEDELNDEIEDHYFWPDLYVQTFRRISRGYWRDTRAVPANQQQLGGAEYASRLNRLVSAALDVVRADVFSVAGGGVMRNNRFVEVRVFNNGGAARGTRTIALLGLELEETGRAARRTIAWLTACQSIDNLLTAVLAVPAAAPARAIIFNAVWNMVLQAAVNVGFYSVWVDVLRNHPVPAGANPVGYLNLGEMFIDDTQANPNPLLVFRGTDVTEVP